MSNFITNGELRIEAERLCDENERLQAENTKLRKLVAKAHVCKTNKGCCEGCYQDKGYCPIEHEMQKLKIEVNI